MAIEQARQRIAELPSLGHSMQASRDDVEVTSLRLEGLR
jgi:hypothetical protein